MVTKNDVTGDEIKSKGFSSDYEDNWTLIFERCAECDKQTKGQSQDVLNIQTQKSEKLCLECYDMLVKLTQKDKQGSMTDLNWDGQ
jgi:hypothetical protein|tara:strand:+ start:227 stop:484 length:258 start_codon:yes stop_codon:yes gene_type:complete